MTSIEYLKMLSKSHARTCLLRESYSKNKYEKFTVYNIPSIIKKCRGIYFHELIGNNKTSRGIMPFDCKIVELGIKNINKRIKENKYAQEIYNSSVPYIEYSKFKSVKEWIDNNKFLLVPKPKPRHSLKISVYKKDINKIKNIYSIFQLSKSNTIGLLYCVGIMKFKHNTEVETVVNFIINRFFEYIKEYNKFLFEDVIILE